MSSITSFPDLLSGGLKDRLRKQQPALVLKLWQHMDRKVLGQIASVLCRVAASSLHRAKSN